MAEKAIRLGGESTAAAITQAVQELYPEHSFTAEEFARKDNAAEIAVDTNFAAQSFWKDVRIRFFRKKSAVLGLVIIIVILLLANKDLDGKTKKIVTVVAAIALVLASLFSIDFNPVSAEELAEAQQTVGNGSVYWTHFGKSYHLDPNCHTLMRSSKVYQGTIEEAFEANRTDPCDFCALEQE